MNDTLRTITIKQAVVDQILLNAKSVLRGDPDSFEGGEEGRDSHVRNLMELAQRVLALRVEKQIEFLYCVEFADEEAWDRLIDIVNEQEVARH